jgi:hypothetical protein
VKALTLWQPYASLIAVGAKKFETRGKEPPWRLIGDRLAIHAAKAEGVTPYQLQGHTTEAIDRAVGNDWAALPRASVLCTARVVGAYESDGISHVDGKTFVKVRESLGLHRTMIELEGDEICFGDFNLGRWLWQLADVRVFREPVRATGKQWVWEWKEAYQHA